jgi:serine/threonine protein kinase
VSIRAPTVLRDVDAFEKKFQVGEGTYGSVFVARDKANNNVVALKRINTEQEENGFPITALREVKILKALKHPNVVKLEEIVCSKGAYNRTYIPRSLIDRSIVNYRLLKLLLSLLDDSFIHHHSADSQFHASLQNYLQRGIFA